MIVKIARILLLIIVVFVTAIYLPYFYWIAFDVNIRAPFVLYSPVINDFVMMNFGQPDSTRYSDARGNFYLREQYEALLPIFNYRQLMAINKMPDSLRGIKLDVKAIQKNMFSLIYRPRSENRPRIGLYPLFESQSGRVRLEWPKELFRINDRMEFIDAGTNRINPELTRKFTAALASHGFQFPSRIIAGYPNVRKPFDEGYFVVDSSGQLFHIKKVKGQPYCKKIAVPSALKIQSLFIKENRVRDFYGLVFTAAQQIYLITYDDYKLLKLPVENFDYRTDIFRMMGNIFFRNISIIKENGIQALVTDKDYQLIDSYEKTWKTRYQRTPGIVANFLFPFSIQLTRNHTTRVAPYFRLSNWTCLVGIGFFFLLTIVILVWKKRRLYNYRFDLLLVLLTGIFGFIAVQILDRERMKI